MFSPFPEEKAAEILHYLIEEIDSNKITIEQVTKESEERKSQGIMLGALICIDKSSNGIILITNSGISKRLVQNSIRCRDQAILIEPIVSALEIENALKKNDKEIHEITEKIHKITKEINRLKEENIQNEKLQFINRRKFLCEESLNKVHELYSFHCADGKTRSLKEIYTEYNKSHLLPINRLPPTGIGDCCAPKLLNYAFAHNLQPISMAEVQYHKNNQFQTVQPCTSRCGILLPAMLGLEIIYRDEDIVIVNKQSGLLSVPGRITTDSVEERFRKLFPNVPKQPAVHRLDMETSGILILAMNKESHRNLQQQFEKGEVQKEYIALLEGNIIKSLNESKRQNDEYFSFEKDENGKFHGTMELYFRLDIENRPHQIWDKENGKKAITEWEILGIEKYKTPNNEILHATRVLFRPHTGRTHQLRLAASDSHGFGIPIIGDSLYGHCLDGERLMLHAKKIHFRHPTTGIEMDFVCEEVF